MNTHTHTHARTQVLSTSNTQVNRTLLSGCAIMLVAPLLFLKNLSSLAPASILALAAVTWLVSIVVYVVFDMTLQYCHEKFTLVSFIYITRKLFDSNTCTLKYYENTGSTVRIF